MVELFAQVILSGFNTHVWECVGKGSVWGEEVMSDGMEQWLESNLKDFACHVTHSYRIIWFRIASFTKKNKENSTPAGEANRLLRRYIFHLQHKLFSGGNQKYIR